MFQDTIFFLKGQGHPHSFICDNTRKLEHLENNDILTFTDLTKLVKTAICTDMKYQSNHWRSIFSQKWSFLKEITLFFFSWNSFSYFCRLTFDLDSTELWPYLFLTTKWIWKCTFSSFQWWNLAVCYFGTLNPKKSISICSTITLKLKKIWAHVIRHVLSFIRVSV